jgi:hypothetical protein
MFLVEFSFFITKLLMKILDYPLRSYFHQFRSLASIGHDPSGGELAPAVTL